MTTRKAPVGGGRVVVDMRALGDGTSPAPSRSSAAGRSDEPLADGDVDDADRGWVGTVGRAVRWAPPTSVRLSTVVVVDPGLDAEAAHDVAARLAGEALG